MCTHYRVLLAALLSISVSAEEATAQLRPQAPHLIRRGIVGLDRPLGAPSSITSPETGSGCPNEGEFSGFPPPKQNDTTFVVDDSPALDTGCTYESAGPFEFNIKVGRVIGNLADLKAAGLIGDSATIEMPAFDVNFNDGGGGLNPERDRVFFNDNLVPAEYLTGQSCTWVLNTFKIPIEWINFPLDPGEGGTVVPDDNTVRIVVDTANPGEDQWCTAIDWASLHFSVPPPVVLVHGTPAGGSVWDGAWRDGLIELGVPFTTNVPYSPLESIAEGSRKVGTAVRNAKERWGVEKVNLVGHSKGGLDARDYAEWNDDVARVIQIGAPNQGTKLATLGIMIAEMLGSVELNLLHRAMAQVFLPAIPDLHPSRMEAYNSVHSHKNPKVKYTALAGEYRTHCIVCVPGILLGLLREPGDAVVTVSSAKGLPFGFDLVNFIRTDPNQDALHWNLNTAQDVFDILKGTATSFGAMASNAAMDTISIIVEGSSLIGKTSQGQTHTHTIQIDDSTETNFAVIYPSGNLDLRVTSPSLEVFDVGTIVGNPDVGRDEGEFLSGRMEVFGFRAPEIGAWSVEVSAPSVLDSIPYVLATFLKDPPITVEATVSISQVTTGNPLTYFARLRRTGSPILGGTVTASIMLPDSTFQALPLLDGGVFPDSAAGDGIYSAQLTSTSLSGNYDALVTASRSGVAGQPDFTREGFVAATVTLPASSFQGSIVDHGADTNGNGQFDLLLADVSLNIAATGRYRVVGVLEDSGGHEQEAAAEADLAPGLRTITLAFSGALLYDNHVNGAYTLRDLGLAAVDGDERQTIEWLDGTLQTAAYAYTSFERTNRTLYIRGSFAYDDSLGGSNKTLPYGWAVAYDTKDKCAGCDSTTFDPLRAALMEEDGHFIIGPIPNRDANDDAGLLDIVVRIYYQTDFGLSTWPLVTLVDSMETRWHSDFPLVRDVSMDTLNLGELKPVDYANRSALHLCRTLDERAWDGAWEASEPVTGLNVVWSPGYSKYPFQKGTVYDPVDQTLYVDGRRDSMTYSPDEWDDVVVLREFAHHVARNLNVLAAVQNTHAACPTTAADSLAWNEGFGLFYSSYIQTVRGRDSSYVDVGVEPSGARNQRSINIENGCITPTCPSGCLNSAGPGNEIAVAGALWDLYDAVNDNPGGDAFGDSIANDGGSILFWIAARRPFVRTIQDFMDYYIAQTAPKNLNFRRNWLVRQVFYEHGIGYNLTGVDETPAVPRVLTLYPSRPNPFNPLTRISFGLPVGSRVHLTIFDIQGRRVRSLLDQSMPPGVHETTWDGRTQNGSDAASGVYYCLLDTATGKRSIKLVLAR